MRKLFALVLAVAMVMSLASVAMAVTLDGTPIQSGDGGVYNIGSTPFKYDEDKDSGRMASVTSIGYGKTVYFALYADAGSSTIVANSDAVKSLKPKVKWDMNGDMVSKVEIVKKKFGTTATPVSQSYGYFIAVTFKDSSSTGLTDVAGKLSLKKTTKDFETNGDGTEISSSVALTVGYDRVEGDGSNLIGDGNKTFKFGDTEGEVDFNFDKWGDAARFTVDVTGQDKIVLKADAKYNAEVAARYPAANLDFYNGNGASFNKIGELLVPAEADTYIYALKDDGTLAKVNATYDEYEEGFLIKTRTLGKYVVSDMELDINAPAVDVVPGTDAPTVTPVPNPNPGTGAVA